VIGNIYNNYLELFDSIKEASWAKKQKIKMRKMKS
jgi:hypothetical protein